MENKEKKPRKKLKELIQEHKVRKASKEKMTKAQKRKVIVGWVAVVYLIVSLISILSNCNSVNASAVSVGTSTQHSATIPFKSIVYRQRPLGTAANNTVTIDFPEFNFGANSISPYYNTFATIEDVLTKSYRYNWVESFPILYDGLVDESDGSDTICFTLTNIQTNATALEVHDDNQPPYINTINIEVIPYLYSSDGSILGSVYTFTGSYEGTDYEPSSTIMYKQFVNTSGEVGGMGWFYDPYTLANFTTILDLYEDNNELFDMAVTLQGGTTKAEVLDFFQIATTRTVEIEDIKVKSEGLGFTLTNTGYIDGGKGFKANYHLALDNKLHAKQTAENKYSYEFYMKADDFILDLSKYKATSNTIDSFVYFSTAFKTNSSMIRPTITVNWDISQVFETDNITGGKSISHIRTTYTHVLKNSITNDDGSLQYKLEYPKEQINAQFEAKGYDNSKNNYIIVNKLEVTIIAEDENFENPYINISIPYYKDSDTSASIINWYKEAIGDGNKSETPAVLTEPEDFFDWMIIAVDGFFTAPIIGVTSLGEILWFAIGVGILLAVLKYFAGG